MGDLNDHINQFKKNYPNSAKDFDERYQEFKLGILIKEARKKAQLTQKELAKRINTKESAISRLENHAESSTIATLRKIADALNLELTITLSKK